MSGENFSTTPFIIGKSLDDCKEKLFAVHGTNYDIVDYKITQYGGIFHTFFQKQGVKTYYKLKSPIRSSEQKSGFVNSQTTILKEKGISVETIATTKVISKQIEELGRELEAKIDTMAKSTPIGDNHPTIEKIADLLQENDFTFDYINKVTTRIKDEFPLSELNDFDCVQKKVVDWIGQTIKINPKTPPVRLPHVTVLVGPTGVGKTTTCAKLALSLVKNARKEGKTVPVTRFITIDKTRVGAQEQIARYGEAMHIDVDKAESMEDLKKLFETYKTSVDELIIDSSGYSQNDYKNIAKMREILDVPGLNPEIYLCISASTKAADIKKIVQNYEIFNYSSVIITKCDETEAYGNIISVLSEKNKKISYVTDGQKVIEDFKKPTVVDFLIRLKDFTIDRVHIDDLFAGDE